MAFPIPDKVKRIWDEWDIRVAVLISLLFQILLIFSAPSRKRTGNIIVTLIVWSAYLLADWIAAFAVGLISNGQGDCPKNSPHEDLLAFWAPFLLLHLGGPDTITAFSLEDNELWIRHLLGLLIQLVAVAYVFSQSYPNSLWLPSMLMFLAGTIKYAERTRALYLACLGNFKQSMLTPPDAGPSYAQLMEEYSSMKAAQVPVEIIIAKEPEKSRTSAILGGFAEEVPSRADLTDVEVVQQGHGFYFKFRGLIVDLMFSFHERNESRKFFFQRTAKDAFRVMEVELNFMYDALFTKMVVVHWKIGYFFRFLCTGFIVAAFQRFASHHKHEFHRVDIFVTYALLIGAIGLDFIAILKLIFSDWTIVLLKNERAKSIVSAIREKLSFDKRCRWSKSVSQHSFLTYCLEERWKWFNKAADYLGVKDFLDEMKYKKDEPFEERLWKFIFDELKEKAEKAEYAKTAKEICSGRGDWVLSQTTCHSLVWSVDVEYDESLLLWHIATELCYYTDEDPAADQNINRQFCKLLSEYMLYLLVMRPTMMSAVAGIGQIRFRDTCEEARKFFRRGQPELTWYMAAVERIRKWYMAAVARIRQFKFRNICNEFKKWYMAAVARIRQFKFRNICNEFKKLLCREQSKSTEKLEEASYKLLSVNTVVKPAEVKGDRSKSVLFDACILAKELQNMKNKDKMWKIMSKVWVELLSYAASHCRANTHAQQLSKGGELITFVWLLMSHFGLGEQFRIEAGHARAKLIVEK